MRLELEPISYGPGHSFASVRFEGTKIICPYHHHPELELVAIDASSGRFVAGDYSGTFREGDIFLLGENLPHIFQNPPTQGRATRHARSHVIQFRRDFAGPGLFDIPEFRSLRRLFLSARRGLKITGPCRKLVRNHMNAVHESDDARRIPRLLELLCVLAHTRTLKPLSGKTCDVTSDSSDGRMSDIMACIQENLTGRLTVPGVARRAGLTPNAFCRYFKQRTKRTFTDVVNQLRIEEACRLLRESGPSVTDICFASGFGNLAHFHSEFRKRLGISPLKFRAQCAEFQ